jgi:hypothetical protein
VELLRRRRRKIEKHNRVMMGKTRRKIILTT